MAYTQLVEKRDKYSSIVASVIEAVLTSNTYIAVAGPEIFGEGSVMKPQTEPTVRAFSYLSLISCNTS